MAEMTASSPLTSRAAAGGRRVPRLAAESEEKAESATDRSWIRPSLSMMRKKLEVPAVPDGADAGDVGFH
jgi:hypothetical protein